MTNDAFLRCMYQLQAQHNTDIHSIDLEDRLNANYMKISRASSYWEEIGAVTHFSQRGGTGTIYRLTHKGFKLGEQLQKNIRKKNTH